MTLPLGAKAGEVQFARAAGEQGHGGGSAGQRRLEKLFLRFGGVLGDAEVLVHLGTERGTWFHWYADKTCWAPRSWSAGTGRGGRPPARWKKPRSWNTHGLVASDVQKAPDPLGHHLTHWSNDPFSRGGFSFNAVGSKDHDRVVLGDPVGSGCSSRVRPPRWNTSGPCTGRCCRGFAKQTDLARE